MLCVSLVSPPCHFKILSRFLKHTVITISFPSGCDAPCPFKDTHRHAPTHIYSIMPCRHAHAYKPYVDIYNIFHRSVDSLLAVNVKRERREFESTQAILCCWIGWILLDSSRCMAKWCTPSVENIRTPCCYWAAPQATLICFLQTLFLPDKVHTSEWDQSSHLSSRVQSSPLPKMQTMLHSTL